jgi:iron(III) transport system permease protein
LPTQAYLQITGLFDMKGGAVLSFLLLIPAFLVFLLQRFWVSRKYYVTISGKVGAKTQIKSVLPWAKYFLLGLCLFISAFILYFYVLLFYASIVHAFGANFQLTWKHYRVVFTEGLKAIRDTLIIAGVGMPLGGIYGVILGYLVSKKVFPSRQAMEIVSMINYALPGTIVGIAYLLFFNDPPIMLTGTAIIIIACYVFRYGPTGIRTTVAILQQIDPSIEEASASLGAGSGTTFRRITIPLILPAFFAGLGVVFIRSMTAISATIFLISINWTLITVRILEKMTELELGVAAAFSILVVFIVFIVITAISLFLRLFRQPGAPEMTNILGG